MSRTVCEIGVNCTCVCTCIHKLCAYVMKFSQEGGLNIVNVWNDISSDP